MVDNPLNTAVVEIHFPASQIKFESTTLICITGANFIPVINEKSIAMHSAILVHKGDTLNFLQPIEGRTTYLAIHGGIFNDEWLYSKSGVKISKGDQISFPKYENSLSSNSILKQTKVETIIHQFLNKSNSINIIPGPAWDDLQPSSLTKLINSSFSITQQSNRMGFKIQGPLLELTKPNTYLSSAVTRGTLQLLPSCEIIVLMADHQTIGGYANLGQIILVDLPRFAQMKTGQAFHFSISNLQTAQQLYRNLYEQFKD
jgi:antagonist of KipI